MSWPNTDGTGGDFQADATGDLLCVSGSQETLQRVIRRCLSNDRKQLPDGTVLAPDYIFDVTYGEGLRRLIGSPINNASARALESRIRSALLQEEGVAASPPPKVLISGSLGAFTIKALWTDASTGRAVATPRITLS